MPHLVHRGALLTLLGLLICSGVAQAQSQRDTEAPGRVLLAEWLVQRARNNLTGEVSPAALRQSAALIEAAMHLDPGERRFPLLLVDAMEQLQDTPGEIAAWNAYRKLVPEDQVAQAQVIDLYLRRIETADAKAAYLRGLLEKPNLPGEVKAHIAAETAALLLDRSQSEAVAMLDRSLQFYPLPEALRLQYELVGKNGTVAQRAHGLVALLRANPAEPQRLQDLARLVDAQGLTESSLPLYSSALDCYKRFGMAPPHSLLMDYVTALYVAGYSKEAEAGVSNLLTANPNDADFWFFRLTLLKGAGVGGLALDQTLAQVRGVLSDQWSAVNDRIPGKRARAAVPSPDLLQTADPADAAKRLNAVNDPQLKAAFVSAVSDMAWFELYFAGQPEGGAKWLSALKQVLPEDDATVRRLQGWYELDSAAPAKAKEQFEAIKDQDALADLGLIKLSGAAPSPDASALRQKLLDQHLTGLLGAIVWEALQTQSSSPPAQPAARPTPQSETQPSAGSDRLVPPLTADAPAVRAELQKFPGGWLSILDAPQHFYTLRADPIEANVAYSQPMLVRITLENVSDQDLTIGPEGVLKPNLWFDGQLVMPQSDFPGVLYQRIVNQFVLRAHASISQVVRIDQGPLAEASLQRPLGSLLIAATVITNPQPSQSGALPGPAGGQVQTTRPISRIAPILTSDAARNALYAELDTQALDQQMEDLELLAANVRLLVQQKDEQAHAMAGRLAGVIDRFRTARSPLLAGWAAYESTRLPAVREPGATVQQMAKSKDWSARLLALIASDILPPEQQKSLAASLATTDPDPVVKSYAAATAERLRSPVNPSTTAPSAP